MKRKIFSKLLMGAFLIASISSFVSCKDYDDDIKDIKAEMQKMALQTSIDNLQTQLTSAASTAQSALAKAEAAATQSALGDVKADLAAVKAAAQTAGENAAKGINDAAAAQTAADAAAAAAQAANDLAAQAQAAADKAQAAVDAAVAAGATKEDVAAVEAEAKKASEAAAAAAKAAEEKAAAAQSAAEATAKSLAAAAQADAVKAANAYTDAAIAAIKADIAKISFEEKDEKAMAEIAKIQNEVGKIAKLEAEVAKVAGLSQGLEDLKAEVAALKAASDSQEFVDAMAALTTKVDGYQAAIDELYSIVTNVELIGTWAGVRVPNAMRLNNNYNIGFVHGKQTTNESFGNNEDKFFQFAAADQVTYKVGDDIRTNKNLLIRVNPTNAEFDKSQIQLVDSKGRDLNEFIEIANVERYDGLITRSVDNTGLWKVSIKVKDGVKKADFNTNVYDGGELNEINEIEGGRQIVYAVAIKNEDTTDNRYVASTYDLRTGWTDYVPANYFNVAYETASTNGTLFGLKNRWGNIWNNDEGKPQDGIQGEDNVDRLFTNPELAWAVPGTPSAVVTNDNVIPAGEAYTDVLDATATNPYDDRRLGNGALEVEVGESIKLSNINSYARRYYYDINNVGDKDYNSWAFTTVEYYYVTLDFGNAIESRPSEYNAWKSYKIKGINEMTHADDELAISIDDTSAAGDYIGFRVYAVNYDGTLVDPDGRAFYVHVGGKQPEKSSVDVSFTANADGTTVAHTDMKTNVGSQAITQEFVSLTNIYPGFDFTTTYSVWAGTTGKDAYVIRKGNYGSADKTINVHYQLLDAKGNVATNWKDIKSVKVSVDKPGYLADGVALPEQYVYGWTNNAAGNPTLNELYINVTKALPTSAAVNPVWRASLEPDANNVLTVYPQPCTAAGAPVAWTASATAMMKDLTQYVNNKEDFENWVIAKKAGIGDTEIKMNTTNGWKAISESKKIGSSYDSYIEYVYPALSTTYNRITDSWSYAQNYTLKAWSGKVTYANAMDLFSFGYKSYNYTNAAGKTASDNKYYIYWSEIEAAGSSTTKIYGTSATGYATVVTPTASLANLLVNLTTDTNKRTAVNAGITPTVSVATDLDPTVSAFDPALYPGGIEATISGQVETLMKTKSTDIYAGGNLTFSRFVNTDGSLGDVPVDNKTGKITVTGKDAFGAKHTIAEIPFTLLFNK